MSNQITGQPNKYDFGLDFNYAVWTPGTVLDLVNVPWNNDYRDVVRFESQAALDAHIDSLEPSGTRIEKLSYVKPNTPVRVNIPINRAIRFNYLRASNPIQPIPGADVVKNYYYFITDVRYLSPNTTEIVLQLDLWQTFIYDVNFGTCYVERGHIGIANENAFDAYGRDYLTIPEGFDLGNEYRVIAKRSYQVGGALRNTSTVPMNTGDYFNVIVFSTVELDGDYGSVDNPKLTSASGTVIHRTPSGAKAYLFPDSSAFRTWMYNMRTYPWITQGIINVMVVPFVGRYLAPGQKIQFAGINPVAIDNLELMPLKHDLFTNWRSSSEILNNIDVRYRHLRKLFTHPYMGIEVTTWSATPITLKPEAWASDNAALISRLTVTPPNARIQFFPRKYNSNGQKALNYMDMSDTQIQTVADNYENLATASGQTFTDMWGTTKAQFIENFKEIGDDFGDYLDVSTQINNFPQGIIVNNGGIAYLAANAHTIDYQRESADWSQQRALGAAQTGYDQASKGLETARALTDISINADIAQTGITNNSQMSQARVSALSGVVGGAAGGALAGGGAGAAAGVAGAGVSAVSNMINTGIQITANQESLAVRNAAMSQNLIANQAQGGFVRDTNKTLADWAAKGDYANSILGINSKVQDAAMIQPTVSGQYGGDTSNNAYGTSELSVRWKLIDDAAIRRIGEYWLRYGYAINQPVINMPDDLMVMTKFTYWKLTETYLHSSPMPESFKQGIRGILEKGVTVWRQPEYIGNTDYADNEPLEGITL